MKKGLLIILFHIIIIGIGFAQLAVKPTACEGCPEVNTATVAKAADDVQVFPNPATNYIQLDKSKDVDQIVIYNVVGRKMKSFKVAEGEKYYINSLPMGMYLVQLVAANNKVITTQRLSKR